MQKVFTIFLLAAMMCVSVCGCSNAPASPEPTPTVFKVEIEDAEPVVTTLLYTGDADALETVMPTESTTEVMYYTEDESSWLQRYCSGNAAACQASQSKPVLPGQSVTV